MANKDRWLVLTDYEDGTPLLLDSRNIVLSAEVTPEPTKDEPNPEPRTIVTISPDALIGDSTHNGYLVVRESPIQIGTVLDAAILYRGVITANAIPDNSI